MWTKQQLIEEAFAELALAASVFDLEDDELQRAARRMDSMAALWESRGIAIGYVMAPDPSDIDLDADSGVPDTAAEAVYTNLAVRLAPGYGKTVRAETQRAATDGYTALQVASAQPRPQQLPDRLPRGAGAKSTCRPFMPEPDTSPLQVGEAGNLDIVE